MSKQATWVAAAILLVTASAAQGSLINRGGGMIYDSDLNITWLQNWNQGAGSGYEMVGGRGYMSWANAKAWADNLQWGGYSDWRLPTMVDAGAPGCDWSFSGTDCGYNPMTQSPGGAYNELAHLWYDTLGNLAQCVPNQAVCDPFDHDWGLSNVGPFMNLQSGAYWYDNQYTLNSNYSWDFSTYTGYQGVGEKVWPRYAVAVRDGDSFVQVPEPQTWALALLALASTAATRRRRIG